MLKFFFTFFCLPLSFFLSAQSTILTGKITDTKSVPLAFVAVLPDGKTTKAVLSDIDGNFSVRTDQSIQTLEFRYVGMQTLTVAGGQWSVVSGQGSVKKIIHNEPATDHRLLTTELSIVMQYADNKIAEVTISAGENPADIIIRKVIANRDRNNPEKLKSFQCETYNKITEEYMTDSLKFAQTIEKKDTARRGVKKTIKGFEKLQRSAQKMDLLLMETVTEKRFRYPKDNYERIILNRISGFQDMAMVALANMVQPFSFYGNYLSILDKEYVNPISPSSTLRYFFNIEDTLYQNRDTVYIISFHPRKGQVFEGLTGVLHINTKYWAVQNVRAVPTNKTQSNLKIEQQYRLVNSGQWLVDSLNSQFTTNNYSADSLRSQLTTNHYSLSTGYWFPEQLNFEWAAPELLPNMGIKIVGKSYVSKIKINPEFKHDDINLETPLVFEANAFNKKDTSWAKYRQVAPLSEKNLRTYTVLDSVFQKKGFVWFPKIIQTALTGKVQLTKGLNLDLNNSFLSNNYESVRYGIGLTTESLYPLTHSKWWDVNGYTGYGVNDRTWKYGAGVKFRLDQSKQTNLKFHYAHDLTEAGTLNELDNVDFITRSVYARYLDNNEEYGASVSSRIAKGFTARLSLNKQFIQPNYNYIYSGADNLSASTFHYTESTIYFKYAFDEVSMSFLGNQVNPNNKYPVFEIAYTHGFDNFLDGKYKYDKLSFALHQSVLLPLIGRTTWRIEGGTVSGNAPISKLFTLNQGAGFYATFYVPNTFQSIGDTLLLFDKFLNIYLRQEIGNVFYRTRFSAPKLSFLQNIAFGSLSNREQHTALNFVTPTSPLLESGLILDNLLTSKFFFVANIGLGGGVFYRWGYQASPDWKENLQFRFNLNLFL